MEKRIVDFDYAPDLSAFQVGQTVCVVGAPVSLDTKQEMHRLATIPHGQHFRFAGQLEYGKTSHTTGGKSEAEWASPITNVWPTNNGAQPWSLHVELCSGLGALGQGAIASQFRPRIAVELRPRLAEGDITEFDTIQKIYDLHKTSATIASGISCQPYSKLGDEKSGLDPRAQTLPATLAIAHYLRAVAVILECVEPAGTDAYVQWQVDQFCKRTGFCKSEAILHLHEIWPCRRSRWWCVLTAPAIGAARLQPFPQLMDLPTIRHIMPGSIQWDPEEEKRLCLSAIELEAFGGVSGSPDSHLLNMSGRMPCALHAWGSQLTPCPCGCRSAPLSSQRLSDRGLYGVLTVCVREDEAQPRKFRHLHPQEAALMCGLDPLLRWGPDVRLALGAVGQLASPLQSLWVTLHLGAKFHEAQFGIRQSDFVQTLCLYRAWLIARALTLFPESVGKLGSEALQLA